MTERHQHELGSGEESFTGVVTDLHHRLYALAVAITADRSLAEDAVAGAYAATWSRYRSREITQLDRYLWRAVARQARRLSHFKRRPPALLSASVAADPAEQVTADAALAKLLAALPANQRTVIALRYIAGFSEAEVADLLAIPAGTVKSRLSRAAEALRRRAGHLGTVAAGQPISLDREGPDA